MENGNDFPSLILAECISDNSATFGSYQNASRKIDNQIPYYFKLFKESLALLDKK